MMLFFSGKEDLGLDASLKLLDLPPDATIEEANQAYAYLHQMIDLFYRDTGAEGRGNRQEDMDLLTRAYEKAVAHLSDQDPQLMASAALPSRMSLVDRPSSTDLHFTINVAADPVHADTVETSSPSTAPKNQSVEDAISVISRRLYRTESVLPEAQAAVESALSAVTAAKQRHDKRKQAKLNALVAAKSANTRALLLEVEAKRAVEDALVVAEKARKRVTEARQLARKARTHADKAREKADRAGQSEKTAAAKTICAEDQLEKAKARLKTLSHTVLQTRHRLKMFQATEGVFEAYNPDSPIQASDVMADPSTLSPHAVESEAVSRQQIMSELLEIEASLKDKRRDPNTADDHWQENALPHSTNQAPERRQHHRIVFPFDHRPLFCANDRAIPILDLSTSGMRLAPDDTMATRRLVRGTIRFSGRRPLAVAGKVVRQDDHGLGLRLVTRIGNHILDQERLCLRN